MAPLLFGESIMFPFNDKVYQSRLSGETVNNFSTRPDHVSLGNTTKIKVEKDHDDDNTENELNRSDHLCNRCWSTFVGIDAYFAHRNNGCDHSQVFIEGVQQSNEGLDSVTTNSNDKNIQDHNFANSIQLCSREIKSEPLDTEDIHKKQGSPNIQTQSEKENSNISGGTCYINPNFSSAIHSIQRINDHVNQPFEKNIPDLGCSKKRTLNVLSPEHSTTTSNIQPKKKIKMSESSKELSRELAEILRKQMSEVNNEYRNKQKSLYDSNSNTHNESLRIKLSESVRSSKELNLAESINAALQKQMEGLNKPNSTLNVNYSETDAANHKEHKDSQNLDLIRNSVNPVSFHNKYSAAFNSRSEPTKNVLKHTRNVNGNSSDCRLRGKDENNNKTFHLKNSNTFSELTYSRTRSFEYNKKYEKAYKDCNTDRERVSNFRSNTLVMYDLNIKTRKEWLKKIFQRYGIVRGVKITRHEHVKRAKGYIEFENLSDAEKAYQLCQNRIIDGSKIKIYCYQYSLDSSPSWIGSGTSEFGADYEVRSTGYPSRRPVYYRNKRPGPYNLF